MSGRETASCDVSHKHILPLTSKSTFDDVISWILSATNYSVGRQGASEKPPNYRLCARGGLSHAHTPHASLPSEGSFLAVGCVVSDAGSFTP